MSNLPFWNRKSAIASALADWHKRGLITDELRDQLREDLETNSKSFSFTAITLLLGVICVAFGVMTFVAANWDGMSSMMRVLTLIAGLWVSWLIAIYFASREQNWLAQLFVLLACTIFGASIMLIGQIYHIQGEPKDATWLWAVGTIIAALITRSVPALALGAILITVWAFIDLELFIQSPEIDYSYFMYWIICAAGAWWLSSRFVSHVLAWGAGIWLFVFSFAQIGGDQNELQLFTFALCGAFILLGVVLISIDEKQWFKGFEASMLRYVLFFIGVMLFTWDLGASDLAFRLKNITPNYMVIGTAALICLAISAYALKQKIKNQYDSLVYSGFAVAGLVIFFTALFRLPYVSELYLLIFSIWIIRMGLRMGLRSVSGLGFSGFAVMLLFIYFETFGSLLDTSLFYFGFGALLLAGAYFIPRIMRMTKKEASS